MTKRMGKGVVFLFCLVLMSSFVLGATTITNVKVSSVVNSNSNYATIKIDATITDSYNIDYLTLYYKLPGSSEIKTALFSRNEPITFIYPNSQEGINFDYRIEISNNFGGAAYTYYPSATEWASYSSTGSSSKDNVVNTSAITSPITGNVINANTNNSAPVTGAATNTNTGVLLKFAQTTAGTVSIVFVALVLVIIMVRVARSKNKKQNTAEVEVVRTTE